MSTKAIRPAAVLFFLFTCIGAMRPAAAYAGVTGSLSGFVHDSQTRQTLRAVKITIKGLELETTTDKYGFYMINNIPAGVYTVKATFAGYGETLIENITIKTDLNTRYDFQLNILYHQSPEVVITAERYPVKKELLSSTTYIENSQLTSRLPIDNYFESFKFLPGIYGNHFRGGRRTDVTYLLDGIPITSPLTRDLAFNLPSTGISEVIVHTGGFSAEYGNAVAGVVNIISRRGKNNFHANARMYTDYVGLAAANRDNARRLELGVGGPLALSFGGPVLEMNYFLTADLNMTDTPYKDVLRTYFDDPIKKNSNLAGLFNLRLSKNLQLSIQGLASNWNWRNYEKDLVNDLGAAPLRENKRLRLAARLTHTVSPTFFYSIAASYSRLQDNISGANLSDIPPVVYSADPVPTSALGIEEAPWNQKSSETTYYLDFNFLKQFNSNMSFKAGLQTEFYNIDLNSSRYLKQPTTDAELPYAYSRFTSMFNRFPRYWAGFGEFRFNLAFLRGAAGVRFDYMNPNVTSIFASDQDSVAARAPGSYTLSPRLALALPIGNRHQVTFNYSRFSEMPPFYYIYAAQGTNDNSMPLWPLLGNTDIKPISSIALDISYLYTLSQRSNISATVYRRRYINAIDTRSFRPGQSGNFEDIPTIYENRTSSESIGLEFDMDFALGSTNRLQFIYNISKSTGSTNQPEDRYFHVINNRMQPNVTNSPLNWDQRHSFILKTHFTLKKHWELTSTSRLYSARQWFNNYLSTQLFEDVPWRYLLDFRLAYNGKYGSFNVTPFFEIRNLFNVSTIEDNEEFFLINNQPLQLYEQEFGRRLRFGLQINY